MCREVYKWIHINICIKKCANIATIYIHKWISTAHWCREHAHILGIPWFFHGIGMVPCVPSWITSVLTRSDNASIFPCYYASLKVWSPWLQAVDRISFIWCPFVGNESISLLGRLLLSRVWWCLGSQHAGKLEPKDHRFIPTWAAEWLGETLSQN